MLAGTGYCEGDALFNITDSSSYIVGDGTITSSTDGVVGLENGTVFDIVEGASMNLLVFPVQASSGSCIDADIAGCLPWSTCVRHQLGSIAFVNRTICAV